jgi:hypothetical protein
VSPAAAPAPGRPPGRLADLAAELAVRGRRAQVVPQPGGLPVPGVAGEPGGPGEWIRALLHREGSRACWRAGLVPAAGSARRAADIIAEPAMPGVQLPALGTGAGHHRAGGGVRRPPAREAGMPGPSPDPGKRQAPVIALVRVVHPGPVPGILPPACPARGRSQARAAGLKPAAAPPGKGRP